MKKTAYALALVALILLGAYPLFAADVNRDAQTVSSAQQGGPTQYASVLSFSGDFGWLQPSLATQAYAGPTTGMPTHRLARAEKRQQQVPFTTGAWLMGLGLVAFIISRKRFRT